MLLDSLELLLDESDSHPRSQPKRYLLLLDSLELLPVTQSLLFIVDRVSSGIAAARPKRYFLLLDSLSLILDGE